MLSVIVPVLDGEGHLPDLFSYLDRAPDWEVIVVDDGSQDASSQIAAQWLDSRSKGRLIQLTHSGPGAARQAGLEAASEKYIAFLDVDDFPVIRVFLECIDLLDRCSADVLIMQHQTIAPEEARHKAEVMHSNPVVEVRGTWSHTALTLRAAVWGKIYRKTFLSRCDIAFPPLISADDVYFSWRVAMNRPRVVITDSVGYWYVQGVGGQLTGSTRYFFDALETLRLILLESRGFGMRSRLLAFFAWSSGTVHILRRVTGKTRPTVMARALGALVGGALGPSTGRTVDPPSLGSAL